MRRALFLFVAGCVGTIAEAPPDEGPPPPLTEGARPTSLHRITRTTYQRLVADGLGYDVDVAVLPPDDEQGYFRSNAGRGVGSENARSYRDAAELIAQNVAEAWVCAEGECFEAWAQDAMAVLYRRRDLGQDIEFLRSAVYEPVRVESDVRTAIQASVEYLLQSPEFLYRIEDDAERPVDGGFELSPAERAQRLALLIWGGAPDAQLFDAADSGRLDTPAGLREEARRMLETERGKVVYRDFVLQLLDLEDALQDARDEDFLGEDQSRLRRSMIAEVERLVDDIVWDEGYGLFGLLASDRANVDATLAPYYDLSAGDDAHVEGVRHGLLTSAAFLSAHSHGEEFSPILTGFAIQQRLLCSPPPPPPAGVDITAPVSRTETEPCAGCHIPMESIGQVFASFDGVGRALEDEARGGVLIGTDVDGPFEGVAGLVERLRESSNARRCLATNFADFVGGEDGELRRRLGEVVEESEDSLERLLLAYVEHPSFWTRSAEESAECETP